MASSAESAPTDSAPTDSAMSSIHRMLNPTSIAVVGATPRLQYGGRFLKAALRSPDGVRVYPVNPRYDEVMGVRCYPSLSDLPESPDLVGIVVRYDRVMDVLDESARCGAGSAIVISAGFAERGIDERSDLQRQMGEFALSSGVRVCGPNCLGIANLRTGIWATASSLAADGKSGPIGLVSQSGASAFGPFLARALEKGVGYSYIVSTGNEADLGSADFIRYLVDDPHTPGDRLLHRGLQGRREAHGGGESRPAAWQAHRDDKGGQVGAGLQGRRVPHRGPVRRGHRPRRRLPAARDHPRGRLRRPHRGLPANGLQRGP